MPHRRSKRRTSSKKYGGDLGIIGTAAVPLSLLALSKYYASRRHNKSFRRTKSRKKSKYLR